MGWEMWVRMEKITATVHEEARKRQVEEAMDTLEEGPEIFYMRQRYFLNSVSSTRNTFRASWSLIPSPKPAPSALRN